MQQIQLMLTTAGNSAVKITKKQESGAIALELLNHMQPGETTACLFSKVQVDIILSYRELTRNAIFEEIEPNFQQLGFFNTRIG